MNTDSDPNEDVATENEPRSCSVHEDERSIAICTQCGNEVCHRCHSSDLRGFTICSTCRGEPEDAFTPWEDPDHPSAPEALAVTAWGALSSPTKFWEPLRHNPRWLPAFVFGLVCIVFGDSMFTSWEFLLNDRLESMLRENMIDPNAANMPSSALRAMSMLRAIILAPLIFMVRTYMLRVAIRVAGGESDWATTARIFGYSCAGYLWMLLPPIMGLPIGHMLMLFWMFNIQIAGVRHFHRNLSQIESLLVVMIPLLIATGIQCV